MMAHSLDDLAKLSQRERRRLIFRKTASKYRDLGVPIDGNSRFRELIERWIDGGIEMKDVAAGAREPVSNAPPPSLPGVNPTSNVVQTWDHGDVELANDATKGQISKQEPRAVQDDLPRKIDELAQRGFTDHK